MTTKAVWEQIERERSLVEARATTSLALSPAIIARYANSSLDTAYPLEFVYALLGDVHGKTVLDVGCGSGANTTVFAALGAQVIGVDISPDLVRLAQARLRLNEQHGRVVVGSVHDLPLKDASIDLVVGVAILHHLDLRAAAREILRVLKPGGRFIFQEPVRDSWVVRVVRRVFPATGDDISPYEAPLRTRDIDATFKPVQSRAFRIPFVRVARQIGMERFAYRLDRRLLRFKVFQSLASVRVFCGAR